MERVTALSMSSIDDSTKKNHRSDFPDELTCTADTKTICAQNQISDLIIATEVNKILLAR